VERVTGGPEDVQERRRTIVKWEEPWVKLLPDHTPIVTVQTIHLKKNKKAGPPSLQTFTNRAWDPH
jgi:hypothetical protein